MRGRALSGTGSRGQQRPTPDYELALLLSGTRERRERFAARVRELSGEADWDRLGRLLDAHRVLPVAGLRLSQAGVDVPESFAARVAEARRVASVTAMIHGAFNDRLLRELDGAAIAALPLKGVSLAQQLYGDPGLRPTNDIDVLVPPEALPSARNVLVGHGYEDRPEPLGPDGLPRLHLEMHHPAGLLPGVEIHWRVHWYERELTGELLASRQNGGRVPHLPPLQLLVTLLLFYARDGFVGLRLVTDLSGFWDRFGAEVVPSEFAAVLRRHPSLEPALRAAALAAADVVGLPAERFLPAPAAASRRVDLARRLADWTADRDPDQVSADVVLVDGLLTPRAGRAEYVHRSLVPPADSIQRFYDLLPDARVRLLMWRLLHPPKLMVRFALALWAARRGRRLSWIPAAARP